MNDKMIKRIAAGALCCLLVCGSAGVYASKKAESKDESLFSAVEATPAPEKKSAVTVSGGSSSSSNVYVITGADGSVTKAIVTDSVKNRLKTGSSRVYDVDGNEVNGVEEVCGVLPVKLSFSYTLNGVSVTPEELEGKSGSVTIRIDYQNTRAQQRSIDGKQRTLYAPYLAFTAMLLDGDIFSNVSVTNGMIIGDGSRMVVAGLAFPGLTESLSIDSDKLDIPEYIEISATVKGFELDGTYTIVTDELFRKAAEKEEESDLDTDELSDSMDDLSEAMDKLMDGSYDLYDGLRTLLDKSYELVDGVNELLDGAYQLCSGASELDSGAAQLYSGANELNSGLNKLTDNNSELNAGAKKVFNTLLSAATSQLREAGVTEAQAPDLTIENYATVLDALSKNMAGTVEATVKAQVTAAVKAEVTKTVRAQVLKEAGLSEEQYSALPEGNETEAAIDTAIESNVATTMASEAVQAQITAATAAAMQGEEATKALQEAAGKITALKTQLDEYNKFYTGLATYTAGVSSAQAGAAKLTSGAAELKAGTAKLYSGTIELYDGVRTMQSSMPELIDGVQELTDGSKELHDGIVKLNDEGIQKIIDAFDGDLTDLADRLKALRDMAEDEKIFSGVDEQPRFIYKSAGIGD